jgi:DNA-binding response OmpR family regulator
MQPGRFLSTRLPPIATHPSAIMLVTQEDARRAQLTELLRCERHVVQTFSDGHAALSHLARHRIDMIVTDLRMPQFEGGEYLTKLREHRGDADVIVMSGAGAETISFLHLTQLGATEILDNSFPLEELLATVRGMLAKRS